MWKGLHCKNEMFVLNQLGLSQLQLHYQTMQILLQEANINGNSK